MAADTAATADSARAELTEAVGVMLGTDHPDRALRLLDQVTAAARARGSSAEDNSKGFAALLISLRDLAPRDEVERMLVVQMIGIHEALMECLRRSMLPDQTLAGRDMNLKHAAKLAQVYARQVEALDRHRGKGQQKITVEHVTVEAGGQAVVGTVELGGATGTPRQGAASAPMALADDSAAAALAGESLDALARARSPTRRGKGGTRGSGG